MSSITLNDSEANAILEQLDNFRLSDIRHNTVLIDAINKLNGTYNYSAFASAGDVANHDIYSVMLKSNGENKVSVIKTIRAIIGLGLKEAKDIADAAGSSYVVKNVSLAEANNAKSALKLAGADAIIIV